MIKNFLLLFNLIVLLVFNVIVTIDLTVTPNIPAQVEAGTEFTFELKIFKGNISGFAKVQQDLPEGFTATEMDSKGASFTFSENKVKLIWMSLPAEEEFMVTFKVSVAPGISGEKIVGGKFSYLENNERKSYDIPQKTIMVGSGATAQTQTQEQPQTQTSEQPQTQTQEQPQTQTQEQAQTQTQEQPQTQTQEQQPQEQARMAETQTTQAQSASGNVRTVTQDGDKYKVEITLQNTGITGFAKAQDILPAGVRAEEGTTNNAVFSFVSGKAKFVWMSLPNEKEIKISYNLFLDGTSADELKNINGEFSYLENNETKKVPIITAGAEATAQTQTQQQTETQTETQTQTDAEAQAKKDAEAKAQRDAELRAQYAKEEQERKNEQAKKDAEANATAQKEKKKEKKSSGSSGTALTNTPSASNGVNYRVQVCAGHQSVKSNHFESAYKFTEEQIFTENHEGWIKYTIGAFGEYKSARDRREQVTTGYTFPGPFVAAYNNGARITVQEALMITRQRWVQ